MVDGHPLEHLILRRGDRVVAYGRLESADRTGGILHVVCSHNPTREGWLQRDDVEVRFARRSHDSTRDFLRVTGIWDGRSIIDADATITDAPRTVHWQGKPGTLTPRELGQTPLVDQLQNLVARSSAPVIATGGTRSAMWIHVLYVTSGLARAHRKVPVQTDVFTSIVRSDSST